MKKLFGEGGIVGLLSRHCEKMVFGLAVLIVIWVALPDGDRTPIDESTQGPAVLKTKADGFAIIMPSVLAHLKSLSNKLGQVGLIPQDKELPLPVSTRQRRWSEFYFPLPLNHHP